MSKVPKFSFSVAVVMLALGLVFQTAGAQQSPVASGVRNAHVFPAIHKVAGPSQFATTDPGPLLYHTGGSIMPSITTYAIFWAPPTLQTDAATTMTAHYRTVLRNLLTDYPGHGLGNNNTQYSQTVGTVKTYVQNRGSFGGYVIDTSPYPASGCTDTLTPGNCLSDAQIQAEIQKVMTSKGWTGGLNKMFLLFTSSGEGSCLGTACAYNDYCGYHGYFTAGTTPVIYSNQPYGDTNHCQAPNIPSPNSDPQADAAASIASHEIAEAITDPLLDAWWTALTGSEIGDLCAYQYGTNTWNTAKANQMWNGHVYELQMEWDNHKGGCVQLGP